MNRLLTFCGVCLMLGFAPGAEAAPLKALKVDVGMYFACALMSDRQVKCWGSNPYGQLGYGDRQSRGNVEGTMGNRLAFVDLGVERVRQIAVGDFHACVLFDASGVKCWGRNDQGQLGLGDVEDRGDEPGEMGINLPLVVVAPPGVAISSLVAGSSHTCALMEDGTVSCWGSNDQGQLGIGSQENHGDEWLEFPGDFTVDFGNGVSAMQITAGEHHTCALLDDGSVACWGFNYFGQLGIGSASARGDGPFEMGGFLRRADLGTQDVPVMVSAGGGHSCALFMAGQVKCWGSNDRGELGTADTEWIGNDAGEMGDLLPFIDFHDDYEPAVSITSGGSFNCVVAGQKAVCWGFNGNGELGQGHDLDIGDNPDEMDSLSLDADIGASTVAQVSAGTYSACARFSHGRIKCWGYNGNGLLGLEIGHFDSRGTDADLMGDALPYIDLGSERAPTPGGLPTLP